jgi:integrase
MAVINKLSDKQLKAIHGKPYSGQKVISDGAGLSARVSPKGKIAWVYRYRLGGRNSNPKWLGLGNYPETSIKQAREKRDQCREWLDNGLDPSMEIKLAKEKREKPVTVADALEYWLVEYAEVHRTNAGELRAHFKNHITPYIGHLPLEQVSTHMWVSCFDQMRKGIEGKQKPVPVLAGILFGVCKQALLFCRKRGFAISHALNDLVRSDVGRTNSERDRVLTEDELTSFLDFITHSNKIPAYYKKLALLLIIFGCRTQEIRRSEWKEWDFESLIWTVPKEHSKIGVTITRPIPESLVPYLQEIRKETGKTGYVLGGLKPASSVSNFGRSLWEKLNHQNSWTFHDLRRTMATRMNDLGVMPHVVDHLLSHVVGGVSGVYNRSQYFPDKKEALEKWLDYLGIRDFLLAGRLVSD